MTFDEILTSMSDLYHKKNSDYGNSFDKTLDEFGLVAALVRLNDKLNRAKQLYKASSQQILDEKIEDTIIDLANYAVMTYKWLMNQKSNEN